MCKKTTFSKFHLNVKIDLVEVVYHLKQVFDLLYDKSHAGGGITLHFFNIIDH